MTLEMEHDQELNKLIQIEEKKEDEDPLKTQNINKQQSPFGKNLYL